MPSSTQRIVLLVVVRNIPHKIHCTLTSLTIYILDPHSSKPTSSEGEDESRGAEDRGAEDRGEEDRDDYQSIPEPCQHTNVHQSNQSHELTERVIGNDEFPFYPQSMTSDHQSYRQEQLRRYVPEGSGTPASGSETLEIYEIH